MPGLNPQPRLPAQHDEATVCGGYGRGGACRKGLQGPGDVLNEHAIYKMMHPGGLEEDSNALMGGE